MKPAQRMQSKLGAAPKPQRRNLEKGEALELMAACMTRNMKGLTAKVSGWLKASPLERRVRPEGLKGAPSLEDVRGP